MVVCAFFLPTISPYLLNFGRATHLQKSLFFPPHFFFSVPCELEQDRVLVCVLPLDFANTLHCDPTIACVYALTLLLVLGARGDLVCLFVYFCWLLGFFLCFFFLCVCVRVSSGSETLALGWRNTIQRSGQMDLSNVRACAGGLDGT